MQPELDELLSGLRHLRRRAARGDLAWIETRFADGRLTWLQKLLPAGGYDRLGRDLVTGNVASVRRALADIDDTTVGERLGYRTNTRRVGADTPDDEPLLVSIEPDAAYASQLNTAPHHPLDEFVIDPEPLDTQFAFGAIDDPYFGDDNTFNDRFEAALGSGFDDGGYDTRVGYDDGDRIVIVDDEVAGRTMTPGRPRPRTTGYPPNRTFGDSDRRANPLTWLFILAGLVLVFALVFSQCGDGGGKPLATTGTSTTLTQTAQTVGLGASGTVSVSPSVTAAVTATAPVTTGGAVSGVRQATTWVIYFAVNSATIDSAGQQVINQVAERLRASGVGTPVGITGYSDTSGNPTANQQLSLSRASVVRDAIQAAVPQAAAKFSVDSKGDTQPDPDPAKSRRVTITVS
jgi:outer membrane protein OmpA-like peptidoglycan-associated protein